MRTALWLLDRFGVPDAVVGDIIERSRAGKSGWWIWRQAIAAIAVSGLREARQRPWLALRGVALGLVLLRAVQAATRFTTLPFDEWLGRVLYDYLNVSRSMMLLLTTLGNALVVAPCWFVLGWLVARWHPRVIVLIPLMVGFSELLPGAFRQTLYEVSAQHSIVYKAVHVTGMAVWITSFTAAILVGAFWIKKDTRAAA